DLCDQYQLQPTIFYQWQKQFFENGAATFTKDKNPKRQETQRIVKNMGRCYLRCVTLDRMAEHR
ncbi:MAG: hypothetical protein OEW15_18450, partial [Nitrospirota bacterium]|nr:hypothetical protein [Nitrospirota bacterium]